MRSGPRKRKSRNKGYSIGHKRLKHVSLLVTNNLSVSYVSGKRAPLGVALIGCGAIGSVRAPQPRRNLREINIAHAHKVYLEKS